MDHEIEINGRKIFYTDKGNGPMIVFIHGWLESHKTFETIVNLLSKKYRCVSIDLPGFGASDPINNVTLNKITRSVEKVISGIGVKKYYLVGHSLGGAISLMYADKNSDAIKKLVLISPFVSFKQFSKLVFYLITNLIPVAISKIIKWKTPNQYAINAFKIAYLLSSADLYKYLRRVRKDILLVYGTRDTLLSIRPLQPLLGIMNNIHLAIYEDVRHYVFTYNSQELADKIDKFFENQN